MLSIRRTSNRTLAYNFNAIPPVVVSGQPNRTPISSRIWVGLIITVPEAHMLHRERDVQARNFGDMQIWDMIFGTYANPLRADVPVGFAPEAMRRWPAMIACIDVNKGLGRDRL